MVRDILGRKIREARRHAGLSVQDLADLSGVATRVVRYWENGRRSPPLERLCCIAVATDLTLLWFLQPVCEKREEIRNAAMA